MEIQGKIFTEAASDVMRKFFKKKSRKLVNKTTTVKEVVSEVIHDGDYIGVCGFGSIRIPTAILHEIVRQGKKNWRDLLDVFLHMIVKLSRMVNASIDAI